MLTIELELLTGVYRASLPDNSGAEWPPHPERVFSALVQAWGDGRGEEEKRALDWLERAGPPVIEASDFVGERDAPTVFVPPNDVVTLPEQRKRQARNFRALATQDPVVRFQWAATPDERQRAALSRLAQRVASVGHSASLVRAAVVDRQLDSARCWVPSEEGTVSLRSTYPGRFALLEEWFRAGQRPLPGMSVSYRPPAVPDAPTPVSVFGGPSDWFLFEGVAGEAPDLLAFSHVAKRVRDALMQRGPQPPPELVSGHGGDGGPSTKPHLAVVPLANVGWTFSDGALLGIAIVLPRSLPATERREALQSLASILSFDGDRALLTLNMTREWQWRLERSASPSRASLQPGRYCRASREWASVTPVLLDRFPDDDDPAESARLVASACSNIGLPEPVEIELHKHSAIEQAPAATPRPPNRWTFPSNSKIASRPRRHVVLRFASSVRGPLLLGAGRYQGFGLCLPIGGAK